MTIHEPVLYDPILGERISFKDLVIHDIKNECTPEEIEILNNNLDLWLYNIRVIRRDVEFQLSSNRSKNKDTVLQMKEDGKSTLEVDKFIAKQNVWRINTVKFLASVERRMLYVKMLVAQKQG